MDVGHTNSEQDRAVLLARAVLHLTSPGDESGADERPADLAVRACASVIGCPVRCRAADEPAVPAGPHHVELAIGPGEAIVIGTTEQPAAEDDVLIASALVAVIRSVGLRHEAEDRAAHLQLALDSRVIIEQAKGVLAERGAMSVDAAFALLRAHSRRTQQRLADVAASVVGGGEVWRAVLGTDSEEEAAWGSSTSNG